MSDVTKKTENNLAALAIDFSTLIHIDSIADNIGSHQGVIADGGLTDDLQPTLSGYLPGAEGLSIRVFLNGSVVGYTVVEDDGKWSYTPETPLIAGTENAFQVSLIDPANGNTQWLSNEYNITTTEANQDVGGPPAAPIIDSVVDDVKGYKGFTGELQDGGLTNDARPALSGRADAGSIVNIYDNGKLLGSVTATDNGTWTFTPATNLADGAHSLTAAAVNAAGESAQTASFDITVDTVISKPVLDAVTDDQGAARGVVADGGLTDDSRPVLTGHAEANSRVDIHVFGPNGKELYYQSVTAGADGTWSYQPKAFTTQGTYSFGISGVDKAGNAWYDYGDKYSIQFVGANQDVATPAAPVIDSVVDDVKGYKGFTGELQDGGLTNDARPALSGHAEAGAVINIYDNGVLLGSTTAAADGKWTFTPATDLTDGAHGLTVAAVNAAGESAQTASFDITVDTTIIKPVIDTVTDNQGGAQGNVADGGLTDDSRPVLTGHAEANSRVDIHVFGPNGKELYYQSVTAGADGTWSYQPKAFTSQGTYSFGISGVDKAGNAWYDYGDKYSIQFVGENQDDTTAPDVPEITFAIDDTGSSLNGLDAGETTEDTTPQLAGNAEANSVVTIYDNGKAIGSTTAGSGGAWDFTLPVRSVGEHTFTVTATDASGNTSASSMGFELNIALPDTSPPDAPEFLLAKDNVGEIQGPVYNGGTTDDTRPDLLGTAEVGSLITVYENGSVVGSTITTITGSWAIYGLPLSEGLHTFTATATDAAGNVSGASAQFVLNIDTDTTAPDAPVITGAYDNVGEYQGDIANGDATDDTRPVMHGTAEAGAQITIYDFNNSVRGQTIAGEDGSWSVELSYSATSGGGYNYYAVATDASGNISENSNSWLIYYAEDKDTTAPDAPVITSVYDDVGASKGNLSNGASTDDTAPALNGKAEANSIVKIYDNGSVTGSVTADSSGNWSFTPSARSEGKHTFTATATDAAGNVSGKSAGFVVNVDTHTSVTIDGLIDDSGVKTGLVPDGGKSDDLYPTLTGTAEPGSTVYISETVPSTGYSYNASVQTNSDGKWEYNFGVLQHGIHNFSVYAIDAAGNKSAVEDYSFQRVADNFDLPETYSWNFNDKTTQGWTLVDENAKPGNVSFRDGRIYFNTNSELGTDYSGDVMSTTILVRAGQSYNFEFAYGRNEQAVDEGQRASVAMTVNGQAVTSYETAQDGVTYVKGSWTAETSGEVVLAFNDKTANAVGNDFWLDNITMVQKSVNLQGQSLMYSSDVDVQLVGDELHNAQPSVMTLSEVNEQQGLQGATADITDQQQNTLQLTLTDILSEAHDNLFIQDGKQQLAITGDAGDVVELKVEDMARDWQDAGQVTAGGVQYEVYQHADLNVELLVQQGVELQQVS
ncbi:Ig-like domain-containing protein [Pseudomonas sp. M30-35]|uniref:Ig-like domain-containing protein n=1 Tax=Pseudomonas sp. M30-35 TaxID=1981174 RepID=UPI0015AAF99F|nr:Ig-like domain-containing protein [Pseudomonas sp. M30-35]